MPERLRKRVRRNIAWPGTWTAEGRRLEEGLGSELALALLVTKKDCERHRCVCLSASLADSAVVSIITEILEGDGTKDSSDGSFLHTLLLARARLCLRLLARARVHDRRQGMLLTQ